MSPDSSINSHQRKSPTLTISSMAAQNQQSPASSMHQMRHHSRASSQSSMADADDGVSSATPSTHRPYIFMQSSCVPQFAADSGANAPFYTVRSPIVSMPVPESYDTMPSRCPMDTSSIPKSMPKPIPKPMSKSTDTEMVRSSNGGNNSQEQTTATATTTSTTAATTASVMQQRVHPQTNVIYKVSSRPLTPDYAKSYPVMDTTVASSVKGEPELNIGIKNDMLFYRRQLPS